MQPAVLIRLRPLGPWRYGSGLGGTERTDTLFRSDRLYSAVTLAMQRLGLLSEWIDATAGSGSPRVCFTSLFPFQNDVLFVLPPATLWPPPASLVAAPSAVFLSKLRWSSARFVPLTLVETLLSGQKLLADQWIPDAESGCLLRRDRPSSSPFRPTSRQSAAIDRLSQSNSAVHSTACVEFEPGSGLWTVVRFRDEESAREWREPVLGAFRLLAESGFGARRSSGWGQSEPPQIVEGSWPAILLPKLARSLRKGEAAHDGAAPDPHSYWLLSLFSPGSSDSINWKDGSYRLEVRGGHVESQSGLSPLKKRVRMVAEGSVLVAAQEPIGVAVDVSPEGFSHPVYRSGFALSLSLPVLTTSEYPEVIETPDAVDSEAPDQSGEEKQDNEGGCAKSEIADEGAPSDLGELQIEELPYEPPEPAEVPTSVEGSPSRVEESPSQLEESPMDIQAPTEPEIPDTEEPNAPQEAGDEI